MKIKIAILIMCTIFMMSGCSLKEHIFTVDEIRNELTKANIKEDIEQVIIYYEELMARDSFTNEDYLALASLYEENNDSVNQRRVLRRLFKNDPTLENAQLLSNVIIILDFQDENTNQTINHISDAINKNNPAVLKEIFASENWRNNFDEEDGKIEMKLFGQNENSVFQIRTSVYETEIMNKISDSELLYLIMNDSGSIIARLTIENNRYKGSAIISYYDGNQEMIKEIKCTLDDDHCIDSITINYQGIAYNGDVNEDGTTAVAQTSKERNLHNVIYAQNGNRYLVQSDIDLNDFIMDLEFLKLPVYEEWAVGVEQ